MFTGGEVGAVFGRLGITDVVTVPDSTIGQWETGIEASGIRLVRVCREGEAWGVAAGLHLGGRRPLVMIQCTGFFESGDALRNILHDWKLPIPVVIGYRSYLNQDTLPGDTCLVFTEPLAAAWRLDSLLVTERSQLDDAERHLGRCLAAGVSGAVIVAEGKA
ncbi:MAG: hypothetical protein R2882_00175 [Gemmatimonadales bacterium]